MTPRRWIPVGLLLLLAGVALFALTPGMDRPAAMPAVADTSTAPHRVVATYFHTSYRCASCRKLEAYSQEAIEKGFPAELTDGRLVWRVVNLDDTGNRHFVDEYKLFTKSVILSDLHAGKETRWKNLPRIWELLGDQEAFLRYVREETKTYLAEDL